jgi:multiple sugar transport system permease protein
MLTPTLFFNLVTGIIGAFQIFTTAYILFGPEGGSGGHLLFYVTYLYRRAFGSYQLGYGCALAWVLFIAILLITLVVFRSSSAWVYYEGELRR